MHKTLFAAIEWSAENGIPQRRLLEKVSICPQSFTMDMAQALSTDSGHKWFSLCRASGKLGSTTTVGAGPSKYNGR